MNLQFSYNHILRGKSLFQVYFCVSISCVYFIAFTQSDIPPSVSPALSGCSRLILLFTLQSCPITVYYPPHWARGQTVGNEWCIPPYVVQKDCCSKLSVFPCLKTRWAFLGIKHRFKNSQIFTVLVCFVVNDSINQAELLLDKRYVSYTLLIPEAVCFGSTFMNPHPLDTRGCLWPRFQISQRAAERDLKIKQLWKISGMRH